MDRSELARRGVGLSVVSAVAVAERRWPAALWVVIGSTVIAASALLAVSTGRAYPWTAQEAAVLLCLTLASAAGTQFQLELPYDNEESSYDLTDALWIAALLLAAPELVVLSAAAGVLLGHRLRGWDSIKVLFNAAQFSLAVGAAAATYVLLGSPRVEEPAGWVAAVLASVVFHTVNAVAIGTVIALAERTPFREAAAAQISVLQFVGNVALALLGALLWVAHPWALVLLAFPLVLIYLAYRSWLHALRERDAMRNISRAAELVARSGESGTRLPVPQSQDDAQVLAGTLNRMLDRLDGSLARERRFIRETSHELRTPITILRGHLELLGSDASPEEFEETTELLLDELDRMARLVEDMALLARMEDPSTMRITDVDIGDFMTSIASKAQPLLDRPLPTPPAREAGTLRADEHRLTQALINLLANADTHTPAGTTIELSVHDRPDSWRFEVCDDGGGLALADEGAIFEPFHTGRRGSPGSGLGLAIVLGIAKAHGGDAGVVNRPGHGAIFWVQIPR